MIRYACTCARWASIELLSRQGEIEIAMRIEAGREEMISGLGESPLTMMAIVQWRDDLKEGRALLRDIIDLDATYGGKARHLRAWRARNTIRRRRHPHPVAPLRSRKRPTTTMTKTTKRPSRSRRWKSSCFPKS